MFTLRLVFVLTVLFVHPPVSSFWFAVIHVVLCSLITVPLIFISYAVFKHVETEHESGGNLLEFALLGATSFIIIALALEADNGEALSEQMGLIGLAVLPLVCGRS